MRYVRLSLGTLRATVGLLTGLNQHCIVSQETRMHKEKEKDGRMTGWWSSGNAQQHLLIRFAVLHRNVSWHNETIIYNNIKDH